MDNHHIPHISIKCIPVHLNKHIEKFQAFKFNTTRIHINLLMNSNEPSNLLISTIKEVNFPNGLHKQYHTSAVQTETLTDRIPEIQFQHYLTMIGAIVAIPFILCPALCIAESDPARGHIIATMIFVTGIFSTNDVSQFEKHIFWRRI